MTERKDYTDQGAHDIFEKAYAKVFQEFFKKDPILRMKTGVTEPGDLTVEYSDNSDYGKGNKASLCIREMEVFNAVLITQRVEIEE